MTNLPKVYGIRPLQYMSNTQFKLVLNPPKNTLVIKIVSNEQE